MSALGGMLSGPGRLLGGWGQDSRKAGERGLAAARDAAQSVSSFAATGARPVWVRIKPTLSTATAFGWGVLAASVASVLIGAVFGWLEFTVLGAIGIVLLAVAVCFVFGRSAYAVALDLAYSRVTVGERAVGNLTVGNSSSRSLLPVRIELPVGSSVAVFPLPRLRPDDVHDELFTIPTQRRGVIGVGPVRSVRGDVLGLFGRVVNWTERVDLYVHPRTVRLDGSSSGFLKDLEGMPTEELSNSDISFHALRDYVAGDDRRYIHWKTSARTGTLMVRQFEETRRSHLAIGLSTSAGDFADDEQFELAVSVCASLGLQAKREDRGLSVLAPRGPLTTETGKRLLDNLSVVDVAAKDAGIVTLARSLARAVPQASVAVLIFGQPVTPAQMQVAASHLPIGVRIIAVCCAAGEPVSRRVVGDLNLLTVGELDDLPAAMRRLTA